MKSKLLLGLLSLSLPVICSAATITFNNQTSKSDSTIRLHIGSTGPGACSNSPIIQKMTGNEGVTHPKQTNEAHLTPNVEAVLCKGGTCKADLYMNAGCIGDKLTTVILPLGGVASVEPSVSGAYRFVGVTNGIIMMCADGTDNC